MPTVEEMGRTIHALKKGGLKGLQFLGYCNSPSPDADHTVQGFVAFYQDVTSSLTDAEKEEMTWDVIMAEHTLCKITRVKKYLDLYT